MNRLFGLFVVAVVVLALAPAATADTRARSDPRGDPNGSDYPGPGFVWGGNSGPCARQWVSIATGSCGENVYTEDRSGRLDIVSVRHGHRGPLVTHRLTTHRRWRGALLTTGGQISFYFNVDRDAALERRLDIAFSRGKLTAAMRNTQNGRRVGRASASRPSGRSVEVAFQRSLLRPAIRRYRWFAFAGLGCRRLYKVCGDTAPARPLAHALR